MFRQTKTANMIMSVGLPDSRCMSCHGVNHSTAYREPVVAPTRSWETALSNICCMQTVCGRLLAKLSTVPYCTILSVK